MNHEHEYESRLYKIIKKKNFTDEVNKLIIETFEEIYNKYDTSSFKVLNPEINKIKYINRLMKSLEKTSSIVIEDIQSDGIGSAGETNSANKSIKLYRFPISERLIAKYTLAHELEHIDQQYSVYCCQYVYYIPLIQSLKEGGSTYNAEDVISKRVGKLEISDDKSNCEIMLDTFFVNSMDYMIYAFLTHSLGYKFMEEWRVSSKNKDYIGEAKQILAQKYNMNIANLLFDKLEILLVKQSEKFDELDFNKFLTDYENVDFRNISYSEIMSCFMEYEDKINNMDINSPEYTDVWRIYTFYKALMNEYEVFTNNPKRYDYNRKHSLEVLKKLPETNLFNAIIDLERVFVKCWGIEADKAKTLEELFEISDVINIIEQTLPSTFSDSYDITGSATGLDELKCAIAAREKALRDAGSFSRLPLPQSEISG